MSASFFLASVRSHMVVSLLALIAQSVTSGEVPRAEMIIERTGSRSLYAWTLDECRIELVLHYAEPLQAAKTVKMSVRRRESCKSTRSYLEQLEIVGELLDLVMAEEPDQLRNVSQLFWGRPLSTEEEERLLNAYLLVEQDWAHCSDDNCIVIEALARSTAFAELEEVFETCGLALSLLSVENVHRVKVGDLARLGIDRAKLVRSVSEESTVPITATVWFRVDRISGRSGSPGLDR